MFKNTRLTTLGVLFLGFFISLASTKKYCLHFGGVKCLGTEDWTGNDDIEIKLTADGVDIKTFTWNDVNKNDYRNFEITRSFNDNFKIQITELDNLTNRDDDLGTFVIDSEEKLKEQKGRIDPWGSGDYQVDWLDCSSPINEIKKFEDETRNNPPPESDLDDGLSGSGVSRNAIREGFKKIYNHVKDRLGDISEAALNVYTAYKDNKKPPATTEAIDKLLEALKINPFRGIIENIGDGLWPTVIIYGVSPSASPLKSLFQNPLNFFTERSSISGAFGVAIQLDGKDAGWIVEVDGSIGITLGNDGHVGIGINRNNVPGVGGMTYGYTIPADAEIVGGITCSFDVELFAVTGNLQEITYTWGLLPSGVEAGVAYTVGWNKDGFFY